MSKEIRGRIKLSELLEYFGFKAPELFDNEGWAQTYRALSEILEEVKKSIKLLAEAMEKIEEAKKEAIKEREKLWMRLKKEFSKGPLRHVVLFDRSKMKKFHFIVLADGEEKESEWVCGECEKTTDACADCPLFFIGKMPEDDRVIAFCLNARSLCVLKKRNKM